MYFFKILILFWGKNYSHLSLTQWWFKEETGKHFAKAQYCQKWSSCTVECFEIHCIWEFFGTYKEYFWVSWVHFWSMLGVYRVNWEYLEAYWEYIWCILGVLWGIRSTMGYFVSTLEYFGSTLEYIGSTLV